ncbi:MAG: hypothetical protein ABEI76_07240 [Halobacteriales archaeon]
MPVELAITEALQGAFSLYYFSGEPACTGLLFVTQIVVGLCLLIGWRTRVMIVLSFFLAVSLDYRNVLVTSYADTLFRHLLFFGMFLPLGERWSIDARQRERPPRRTVATRVGADPPPDGAHVLGDGLSEVPVVAVAQR